MTRSSADHQRSDYLLRMKLIRSKFGSPRRFTAALRNLAELCHARTVLQRDVSFFEKAVVDISGFRAN